MCIPLIARVRSLSNTVAEAELVDGRIMQVNPGLQPDVQVGAHVLLDRGLIVEVIPADQVEEMLEFYTELTNLWSEQDVSHV
ncbi:MAG: HypC/HybG/HupF family hydrogenase formation chaperone [Chloroflexota bacterium]|nr:HypC/HybG/HupF family hydrogenase formation chaperone [Chloroflexota bacterium]